MHFQGYKKYRSVYAVKPNGKELEHFEAKPINVLKFDELFIPIWIYMYVLANKRIRTLYGYKSINGYNSGI